MLIKVFCQVIAFILSLLFFMTVQSVRAEETPTLYLRVGQKYPLEGVSAQDAKITPENIARVVKTPEGLLVEAHEKGSATLTMTASGKPIEIAVQVRDAATERTRSSVNVPTPNRNKAGSPDPFTELKTLPGIRLSNLSGKLLVQGEILGRPAYQKVLLTLHNAPSQMLVLALPGPGIRESLIEQAESLLANRGLNALKISNAGNRFFLEGSVSTPEELEQAFELVSAIIPNLENHVPLPIRVEPTVLIRVFILELSRQAHEALGLSWPSVVPHAAVLSPTAVLFNPTWLVNLHQLSTVGQARILAEPSLAVKVGSHAELTAGGEIPIRITGQFENKVTWKHYGLSIKLQLAGIAGKYLRTRIETESSQLDEATAVDGVPGLKTNTMNTEIDALVGQPVMLTGLFQSSAAKDVEKVPLLGDIPLLGELFKSRRFREHESELLVALLPTFGAPESKLPLESLHGLNFDQRWRPFE